MSNLGIKANADATSNAASRAKMRKRVDDIMKIADLDGDGKIDFEEVRVAYIRVCYMLAIPTPFCS